MIKLCTGIIRHEDDLGRFEHVKCLPSPWLRGVVHGYTGYSHHSSRPLRRREAAQDTVALILNFGEPLRVEGPTATFEVDSFVAPLNDAYALTNEGIASHGLQVDLSPLGAYMLLGMPMWELSDLVMPLEDVIGPVVPTLVEQLCRLGLASSLRDLRKAADRCPGQRIGMQPSPSCRALPRAGRSITEDRGAHHALPKCREAVLS